MDLAAAPVGEAAEAIVLTERGCKMQLHHVARAENTLLLEDAGEYQKPVRGSSSLHLGKFGRADRSVRGQDPGKRIGLILRKHTGRKKHEYSRLRGWPLSADLKGRSESCS